jgi:hypothetical protein
MEISKADIETINRKMSPVLDIDTKQEILARIKYTEIPTPISGMLKTLLKENQKEPLFRYILDLKRRAKNNLI